MLRELKHRLVHSVSLSTYCRLINARRAIQGMPYRIMPEGNNGIHVVRDGEAEIRICRRGRHRRYKRGVLAGAEGVARQYQLHKLDVTPGGTFIDCGANVGEMGYWARARGMGYIAFEPEALEAECCDLNNFDGDAGTIRKALWKEDTTLTFFSKPDTADSSVLEIDATHPSVEIEAVTLDGAVDLTERAGTNIFKLEAEGAEPEVLQGAATTLPMIDYVAVDCGYERGAAQEHTFIEVHDMLLDKGFKLIEAEFRRVTAIYENQARAAAWDA